MAVDIQGDSGPLKRWDSTERDERIEDLETDFNLIRDCNYDLFPFRR